MLKAFLLTILFSIYALAVIPNEQQINEHIKRGGRPEMSDIDSLKSQGYKTIINLDDDYMAIQKEKDYAEALGFNYIANPIVIKEGPKDDEIDMLLTEMQNPENYPIFIHCKAGRDRTGMLSGLYRVFAENWTADAAYAEMLRLGFRPQYKKLDDYYKFKTRGH